MMAGGHDRNDDRDSNAPRHATTERAPRAKTLKRAVVPADASPSQEPRKATRSRTKHMLWRERIAMLVHETLDEEARFQWSERSAESVAHITACSLVSEADRKTLRLVDLLFLSAAERAAILATVEEWALEIERGAP